MHTLAAPPGVSPADRLGVTIFFAVIAHLILILGVTFAPEDRPQRRVDALDVVLVPWRSEAVPDRPDYLAQANQDGGGESTVKARPRAPRHAPPGDGEPAATATAAVTLSAPPADSRLVEPVPSSGSLPSSAPVPQEAPAPPSEEVPPPVSNRNVVTAASGIEAVPVGPARPLAKSRREREPIGSRPAGQSAQPEPEGAGEALRAADSIPSPPLAPPAPATGPPTPARNADTATPEDRSLAMAALSAEIDRKLRAYAERPRRKWISARTREHRLAAYMDAWRRRVEHVGNLNYPDEAMRRGLSGNLLLEVALNPDGTIENVALRRSSGEQILDDAAVRIVQLAAPFPAFPENIAEEVDVLHIERTWVFHSDNRFRSR